MSNQGARDVKRFRDQDLSPSHSKRLKSGDSVEYAIEISDDEGNEGEVLEVPSNPQEFTKVVQQRELCNPPGEVAMEQSGKPLHGSLHEAAEVGDVNKVLQLLEANANVNALDEDGYSALHHAAEEGHYVVVKCLIENGANVDALQVTEHGNTYTPLHLASIKGHEKIAKLLICNGADAQVKDGYGKTLLEHSRKCGHANLARFLAYLLKLKAAKGPTAQKSDVTIQPPPNPVVPSSAKRKQHEVVPQQSGKRPAVANPQLNFGLNHDKPIPLAEEPVQQGGEPVVQPSLEPLPVFDIQNHKPASNDVDNRSQKDKNITTVLAELVDVTASHPMGPHLGWLQGGSHVPLHSDQTDTLLNMAAKMEDFLSSGGAPNQAYQKMVCEVRYARQITPTLLMRVNVEGGKSHLEFVPIKIYKQYLIWMNEQLSEEENARFAKARGAKFDWEKEWSKDTFLAPFTAWYNKKTSSTCSFQLVVASPTPSMIGPDFIEGGRNYVVVSWLAGSPHKGPLAANGAIRTNFFATKPELNGSFTSDQQNYSCATRKEPRKLPIPGEFSKIHDKWRNELKAKIIQLWDQPKEVKRYLNDFEINRLVNEYRNGEGAVLQCMSGASHYDFLKACMYILRELPTTGAMLAYLYHAPTFEVGQDYDPCVNQTAARQLLPKESVSNVVSKVDVLSTEEGKVCNNMMKLALQRMHYYAAESSGETHLLEKVPKSVDELLSSTYNDYRMCIHRTRIHNAKVPRFNICHGALGIPFSGYGLPGKVFTNPDFAYYMELCNASNGVE